MRQRNLTSVLKPHELAVIVRQMASLQHVCLIMLPWHQLLYQIVSFLLSAGTMIIIIFGHSLYKDPEKL